MPMYFWVRLKCRRAIGLRLLSSRQHREIGLGVPLHYAGGLDFAADDGPHNLVPLDFLQRCLQAVSLGQVRFGHRCAGDAGSHVGVLLDFDTRDAATGFLEKLRSQVWDKPEVIGQLMTAAPTARILEEVAREGQGAG